MKFGDTYWDQISGTAMGKPPAPPFASLFEGINEKVPPHIWNKPSFVPRLPSFFWWHWLLGIIRTPRRSQWRCKLCFLQASRQCILSELDLHRKRHDTWPWQLLAIKSRQPCTKNPLLSISTYLHIHHTHLVMWKDTYMVRPYASTVSALSKKMLPK